MAPDSGEPVTITKNGEPVTQLHQKNRMERFDIPVMAWRNARLDGGLQEISLGGDIGIAAAELENFHTDPADRFIVASAMLNGFTLITADRHLGLAGAIAPPRRALVKGISLSGSAGVTWY
jgi:hypothetical protein